ncbi:hypothetical protein B1729_16215 [Microbacterium sp. B35-04]|uniref:NAD-dependent epimerase/dehydratase family protein n=1 Tax=Microbacterium sp. B35-04 TaxID=1961716 RepID=UPI0013D453C8|nr:NAD-dependent epimerase/dehydratase family protein [Microbacterium sp. B35-04]KAF2412166.1 hypothetical protein B1729_16215 [Microbacterium sp. B35-04]
MPEQHLGSVLVTGGAGFVGCALASRLAATADRWIAVDSLNPRIHASPRRPAGLTEDAELVIADITEPETWSALLQDVRPDIVVHLVAETDTGLSLDNATRFAAVNVGGTAVMLDRLAQHDAVPAHILIASSRAVYGEGLWRSRSSGDLFSPGQRTHRQLAAGQWDFPDADPQPSVAGVTPAHPTSIYGATKHAQDTMLSAWCGSRDVELTILRLQNVYGPGQSLINPYTGLLPLFVQIAGRGEPIDVFEDGLMTRDFVHVEDVARAFETAMQNPRPGAARVIDVGSGEATPILEVARLVSSIVGGAEPAVTGRYRDGDVRHAWTETTLGRTELGWSPSIGWRDGISDYVHWYTSLAPVGGGR